MEAHADFLHRLRDRVPHLHLVPHQRASMSRLARIGIGVGIVGGLAMALPLLIYDWAKASHSALELPMAVSGWLFGLNHFGQNDYHWWPIVIGALFLFAFWSVLGWAFSAIADRVYHVATLKGALALGAVWSFVSFIFTWYMVMPIARDGAPFRLTAAGEFVAPTWVWILGFTAAGLATGLCYRAMTMRMREAEQPVTKTAAERQAA